MVRGTRADGKVHAKQIYLNLYTGYISLKADGSGIMELWAGSKEEAETIAREKFQRMKEIWTLKQ